MTDVEMIDENYSSFEERQSDFTEDDSDFSSEEENAAPKRKKQAPVTKRAPQKAKKKQPVKKAAKGVLVDTTNNKDDDFSVSSQVESPGKGENGTSGKTIEQIYQKKTQLEHILLRPDTYIGSVERVSQDLYVLSAESDTIILREVTYTPGLFKIFDEIVVNASDNKQRDRNMDKLDITIDADANTISVTNNGKTIPVQMHRDQNCYVPTLIFGQLLTGSNFDDDEKKTTGGRNGYGAKLANIFSTEFVVECIDTKNKLKFHQVFRDNMTVTEDPTVTAIKAASVLKSGDSTKITFKPDLKRFKMGSLDEDTIALLSKRAYDIAGAMSNSKGKRLTVSLNGKKLPVKSFRDYIGLYEGISKPTAFEKVGDRWEVGVGLSEGSFQQISFVNSICTSKGGQHIVYIADQVAAKLHTTLKKKNKGGGEIKVNQIKNHLCVFVNCLIENPAFDSQTKEFMTTRPKSFGSECKLSEKFLKQVEKSDIVEAIMNFVRFKQGEALKRKGGAKKKKLTGIAKLDDANFAGSPHSRDCTLIITEGDSAKSLAMSGLSVVGRDYYGVFPLKGKPLNVRDASHNAIMKNEEIKNLVDIMGLKFGFKYDEDTVKNLRYGHLMIMADQDSDGSHIKGLIINFIHHFWPSLLDVPGFLQQFITPIVKASKGNKSITFFTVPEYEAWKEANNNGKGYKVKYYKGLGTSTSSEGKEYFSNLDQHELHFNELSSDLMHISDSDDDGDEMTVDDVLPDTKKRSTGNELIRMAFSKDRVADRKKWLNDFKKGTYMDYSAAQRKGVRYSDFINKEFVLFSLADNSRSIPHLMDGFKPSQRKVLFACFKRKLKGEIKVAQLAGYIGEHSAYHHGEASLAGTIINMAQSFCGSNNVNLLTPSGQFGTRRMGGKDHASPRYIFTKLEKITRTLFHPDDDALLTYLNDDGLSIEPEFYMPVIPMALVNGADGIGTGWSSSIPNYDPRAIIANIRRIIRGDDVEKMTPCYYGFTGEIIPETGRRAGSYQVKGIIERIDDTTIHISELPIKKWTQDFKTFLEKLLLNEGKSESEIKDFKENHTDDTVSFTVIAAKEKIDSFEKEKDGLEGKFKLATTISTSNMHLFNQDGRITKYETPEKILESFYEARLDFYCRRKDLLLDKMRKEQLMLSNKARFVEEVCKGELIVSNRKRTEILSELQEKGYDLLEKDKTKSTSNEEDEEDDKSDEEDASDAELARGYEYLLGMKIWSLTFEKVSKLKEELSEKIKSVEELERTSPSDMWLSDLDAIEEALNERDCEIKKAAEEELRAQNKNQNKKRGARKGGPKGRKKKSDSSDEEFVVKAPTKKKAPPARKKKGPASKQKKKILVLSNSDSEVEVASLADKMKQMLSPEKNTVNSEKSVSVLEKKPAAGKKRVSPKANQGVSAKKPKALPKKVQSKKKTRDEPLSSEEEVAVTVPAVTKRSTRARTAPKTYAIDLLDSESEKSVDSESDVHFDESSNDESDF